MRGRRPWREPKGAAVSGILDEGGLPVLGDPLGAGRAPWAGEIPVGAGGLGPLGWRGPVTVKPLALRMLGQDEAESLILAQNERWRRA